MNDKGVLKTYLKKGFINKMDRIFTFIAPNYSLKIAKRIFSDYKSEEFVTTESTKTINFSYYKGNNECAKIIKNLIEARPHPSIKAALVHGSIADENDISYSDFDGILLIDSSKIKNASQLFELRSVIAKTEQIMYSQDALQHHGWEIFTLEELLQFKDHAFPLDLILEVKTLYFSGEPMIDVKSKSLVSEYPKSLESICHSLKRKCESGNFDRDAYYFKNLMSEIMLLPALFLQAKRGKSILKKDSFSEIKRSYPNINISLIDQVSHIRLGWTQEEIKFRTQMFHRFRKAGIYLSFLAPQVSEEIKAFCGKNLALEIGKLCDELLLQSNTRNDESII